MKNGKGAGLNGSGLTWIVKQSSHTLISVQDQFITIFRSNRLIGSM